MLANRLDKSFFVKADARSRYELVVVVVDNLRAAGVDQLGLITEQLQDTRNAPASAPAAPSGK
jgi:biopolymer transport protein ExbD